MARWSLLTVGVLLALVLSPAIRAQQKPPTPAATQQPDTPKDPLGRDTPRQTVLGFLDAGRANQDQLAAQYLDTDLTGPPAALLAHQFFVVLDARLPANLKQLSDVREGSRSNPLLPDQEVVGKVESAQGELEIVLLRTQRANAAPAWMFSRGTLASIPAIYDEITQRRNERPLYRLLSEQIGQMRILESLSVLLGLAAFYGLTLLLNRILSSLLRRLWPGASTSAQSAGRSVLPLPARLLV